MKTCAACKHITIRQVCRFSSVTFDDGSISCDKGHFYNSNSMLDVDDLLTFAKANTCPDYELSDLAKSKGWTE